MIALPYLVRCSLRQALRASVVVAVVSLAPTIQADAVAYEPFDYPAGALGSASGGTGWAGDWSSSSATFVAANDLTFGSLDTSGGSIGDLGAAINRFVGSRAIDLSTPGLLEDGTELWFSVIMGYDTAGNRTNSRLALVLGTDSISTANGNDYTFTTETATGLGVTFGRFNSVNGNIVATRTNDADLVFGTGSDGSNPVVPAATNTNVDYALIVGRITWGELSDTIDLFLPDANLNLGDVHSTLTTDVDQSGYDTISSKRGDRVVMDEIRFGATVEDVLPELVSDSAPQLVDFTYNPLDGASEVSIKGTANTDYKLTEADDLDFSAPDQDPIPLTGATVGTLNVNQVTTDANGDATVQFNLGTSKPATFIRAVSVE